MRTTDIAPWTALIATAAAALLMAMDSAQAADVPHGMPTCGAGQDVATCAKEAGAAKAEARRGLLNNGDADYARNARARCDALPASDRQDCRARIDGQGTTRGSVKEGGIYRELITREVGVPPSPMAPAVPPSSD